jgi:hypothetical protein
VEKRRRILLYGNSVIMGTIAATLKNIPQYEVGTLSLDVPGASALKAVNADVIFFDSEATRPQAILSLLETCPDLMLIGVSPDTNLVKVYSGRQLRELSTMDLLTVIEEQPRNSTVM